MGKPITFFVFSSRPRILLSLALAWNLQPFQARANAPHVSKTAVVDGELRYLSVQCQWFCFLQAGVIGVSPCNLGIALTVVGENIESRTACHSEIEESFPFVHVFGHCAKIKGWSVLSSSFTFYCADLVIVKPTKWLTMVPAMPAGLTKVLKC